MYSNLALLLMNTNIALKKFIMLSDECNHIGTVIVRCAQFPQNDHYEAYNLIRERIISLLDEIEDDLFDDRRENA